MASGDVSFPFNAVAIGTAPNVTYDRTFYAADFAAYFAAFIGTGVYPNPSSNFRVSSLNNNLTLTISAGKAFINGYYFYLREDMTIAVDAPDSAYKRVDGVILRLDLVNRVFTLTIAKGAPAASPTVPPLVRSSDLFDIRLAEVSVRTGAAGIMPSDILDTRLDGAVCGIVQGLITQVDTTAIFSQYQALLNAHIADWNSLWNGTKASQDAAWNAQMSQQANDYAAWKGTIEAWKNLMVAELSAAISFMFDNDHAHPGTTITYPTFTDTSIIAEMRFTAGNALFAKQTTTFNADGSVVEDQIVYQPVGTVFSNTRVTVTFTNNIPRIEVISLI